MAQAKIGPSDVPGKKAGPNGSFPVGDKKHAKLAIGGATRSERAGNISPAEEAKIKAEARKKLGDGKPKPKKKTAGVAVPEFSAGRRSFGGRSFGQFAGGPKAQQAPGAPGLGGAEPGDGADDDEAMGAGE